MYLCDECGNNAVRNGECKHLSKVWGVGNIPFRNTKCARCGVKENCMVYPIADLSNYEDKK